MSTTADLGGRSVIAPAADGRAWRIVGYAGPAALVVATAACLADGALADGATGATGAAGAAAPAAWTVVAALVAVVVGVPHGAVDHLALAAPLRGRRRAAAAALYLGLAAAGAAAVLLAPLPSFLAVVALSVWHFGSGDLEWLRETGAGLPRHRVDRALLGLAAGAAPVLLPLTSASGGGALVALEPALAPLAAHGAVPFVRAATAIVVLVALARLAAAGARRAAGELAVLLVAMLLLPAFLAFALYFAAWHALRHTMRLALDAGALDRDRLRRVARDGLPSLAVAVALVAAAAALGATTAGTLWLALAAVWGLTVPHTAAVTAFDVRRRRARGRRALSRVRPSRAAART